VQVQATRILDDPVAIAGTPLTVCAPKGWVRDSGNPRLFGKLIRKEVWGRERWAAERTLEFHYNDFFHQFVRMFQAAALHPGTPAAIGEWNGVQYVVARNTPQMPGHTALRWATTPAGEQIGVTYTPLAEISHGDLYLLDEICAAVQSNGTRPEPASTLPDQVGVSFPAADGRELLGPDDQGGPGFWVQELQTGQPIWAIGIFRRSIDPERWPDEIEWFLYESRKLESRMLNLRKPLLDPRRQVGSRADGAFVGVLRNPVPGRSGCAVVSFWTVAQSPTRAAAIYVLAVPAHARRANDAGAKLAETLEFRADYPG
jgi:hypothetical protein